LKEGARDVKGRRRVRRVVRLSLRGGGRGRSMR
jgi:hypothetical protein